MGAPGAEAADELGGDAGRAGKLAAPPLRVERLLERRAFLVETRAICILKAAVFSEMLKVFL